MRILFYLYPGLMSQGPEFTAGHTAIMARIMGGLAAAGRAQCMLITGKRFTESISTVTNASATVAYIDEVALHREIGTVDPLAALPTELCRQARSAHAAQYPAIHVLLQHIARAGGQFEPDLVI